MPRDPASWYVMIDDRQAGPLTRVELGVELASGTISGDSLVWKDGMAGWVPGVKVPELAALFKSPPKSPRVPQRAPEKPKPPASSMGMSEFDTAHFRVAALAPEDTAIAAARQLEFDTAHFKLAALAPEDDGKKRDLEFDTAHFRLAELQGATGAQATVPRRIAPKGMEARPPRSAPSTQPIIKSKLKQASTAARPMDESPPQAPRPPAAKAPPEKPRAAAAKAPAAAAAEFDSSRTSVDFLAYGEEVRQQQVAQDLFAPRAPEASAPKEHSPAPRAPSRPPPLPVPFSLPRKSTVPVWFAVGGGVIALLVVLLLLFGD